MRLLVLAFVSGVLVLLLVRHAPWLNGPAYWKWRWQRLDPLSSYPLLLLAAVPFVAGQWIHQGEKVSVVVPLFLLMASSFLLQIAAIGTQSVPFSLGRIAWIVEHPQITSYYVDAGTFTGLRDWLGSYPEHMRSFHLHAVNKPPGPILYYVLMLRLFGHAASQVGGVLVGVLASASIPATYVLIRTLGGSERGAFLGASFLALCPGPTMFFPEFDQIYPVFVCAVSVSWLMALQRRHWGYAGAFGGSLFLLTFFSFGLLVIGAFLSLLTLVFLLEDPRRHAWHVVSRAAVGLGVLATGYVLLRWASGYDPLATFRAALQNQKILADMLQRPYPKTILFDLTDFALGTGWISFLLTGFYLTRFRPSPLGDANWRTAVICVLQILLVAVAGLLPTETARVWIFLMPLLMFPVGQELARWSRASVGLAFASLWLLLAAVHQNLLFISG